MTDERKPADDAPVEAWDDEGGAGERETAGREPDGREPAAPDDERRDAEEPGPWADERSGHWHGAASSDATQARADEE
ncbi:MULTISPECIES: hypothetical protein [unclassified Agromyces]|uniref:hypothetical protein n=1 Tax=unclassified Agromyces TaxID=2639701 RepID=UPI0030142B5A